MSKNWGAAECGKQADWQEKKVACGKKDSYWVPRRVLSHSSSYKWNGRDFKAKSKVWDQTFKNIYGCRLLEQELLKKHQPCLHLRFPLTWVCPFIIQMSVSFPNSPISKSIPKIYVSVTNKLYISLQNRLSI